MIRLDFNKKIEVVKNQAEAGMTLNEVLAYTIAHTVDHVNPVKLWNWAKQLSDGKVLEIDKPDAEFLQSTILKDQTLFVSGKAQILEVISTALAKAAK